MDKTPFCQYVKIQTFYKVDTREDLFQESLKTSVFLLCTLHQRDQKCVAFFIFDIIKSP